MNKKDREIIFNKFGGRCAYCGCELQKGWHVDEIKPIRRNYRTIPGRWSDGYIRGMTENQMNTKGIKWIPPRTVPDGCTYPDRLHIDNQNPACASCNINKHSATLEQFRDLITNFIRSLNRDSTQYKIAKRFGLVVEVEKPVTFYFETYNPRQ